MNDFHFFLGGLLLLPVSLLVGAVVASVFFYLLSLFMGLVNKKWLETEYEKAFFCVAFFCVGTYYGINLSVFYANRGRNQTARKGCDSIDKNRKVYICTSGSSKRYHADKNCKGLWRCSGEIEEVSVEDAEGMGRTPCHICY